MTKVLLLHSEAAPARKGAAEVFPARKQNKEAYGCLAEHACTLGLEIYIAAPQDFSLEAAVPCWRVLPPLWEICELSSFDIFWDRDFHSGPRRVERLKACVEQGISIASHPEPEWLADDKLKSYDFYSEYIPATVQLNLDIDSFAQAVAKFKGQTVDDDLCCDRLVVKPRYGYSGENIAVVEHDNFACLRELAQDCEYVIQPFLETAHGIPELSISSRHDLRIIMSGGQLISCYVRTPCEDSYLSNLAAGGGIHYIPLESVPRDFIEVAKSVDSRFCDCRPRTLTVDMARGANGRVWVFELNARPGFNWDPKSPEDAAQTKALQELSLCAIAEMLEGVSPLADIDWSLAPK